MKTFIDEGGLEVRIETVQFETISYKLLLRCGKKTRGVIVMIPIGSKEHREVSAWYEGSCNEIYDKFIRKAVISWTKRLHEILIKRLGTEVKEVW